MQTTWIVAGGGGSSHDLHCALQDKFHCEMFSLLELESRCKQDSHSRPDILLLDAAEGWAAIESAANVVHRQSLDAFVVAITNEGQLEPLHSAGWVLDEVIVRQNGSGPEFFKSVADRLFSTTVALERVKTLQRKLRDGMRQGLIVARSRQMVEILDRLPRLASSMSTVLITGETGTGKEQIARSLHYLGPRSSKPFIVVDCGAVSEALIENELFGHVRGAFTDAGDAYGGLIREADGGTLFLDEVEALPLHVQVKLLRFLQEHEIRPLGNTNYVTLDVRVIAATNINLEEAVAAKTFREDLYYRLRVLPLYLPPLRERKSDIPPLVRHFLSRHAIGSEARPVLPTDRLKEWMGHVWPGNIRELENKVQEWIATRGEEPMGGNSSVENPDPSSLPSLAEVRTDSLNKCETEYLAKLMKLVKGNISAGARTAGTDRKSLRLLLRKHGFDSTQFRI